MIKPVLILGIGNILLSDEGVGVRAVEAMRQLSLPEEVEALDGGTSGADLIEVIADRRKVIVIDAAIVDGEPGTIYQFGEADLEPQEGRQISLHELGLLETLVMARALGCAPGEVVIFGIKPQSIEPGLELSPRIQAILPRVIEIVQAEIASTLAAKP